MEQTQQVPASPVIFRPSWVRGVELVALGLIGIACGWLLHMTTTDSALMFPVVAPMVIGALALFLGLHHLIRPSTLSVDDEGVTLDPFGRIPWAAIARFHLITAHGTRYLAIELVEPRPRITGGRWSRWVHGPIGKIAVGNPLAVSGRWLRPIQLDDITAELHRRNRGLVIAASEQGAFRRTVS
ncbi:hypothetical protein [Nocardia sp. NPDC050406]|uniref:hypothetical protein n=1 Tax=Nocardia sp. NPDC050406 TaxID=3364318 RepID=UPI0037A46771